MFEDKFRNATKFFITEFTFQSQLTQMLIDLHKFNTKANEIWVN